jgi:hypothetical protein
VSEPDPGLNAQAIVGQLAVPSRLRIVAALALGATGPGELVERTGLSDAEIASGLQRLMRSGLVQAGDDGLALRTDAFAAAARAGATPRPLDSFGSKDPSVVKVLRAYFREGRLTSIPVAGKKRSVVLEYLAGGFEPGVHYTEEQVNATLRAWHDDVAALRRYLVEEGLLSRAHGEYWRSGGWVDVL